MGWGMEGLGVGRTAMDGVCRVEDLYASRDQFVADGEPFRWDVADWQAWHGREGGDGAFRLSRRRGTADAERIAL